MINLYVYIAIISAKILISVQYTIPPLTLEAYSPKGFRVTLPAENGVQLFAFHGSINKPISLAQPGDFNKDVLNAENNKYTYFDPELQLKVGDEINYWVHVQKDKLGYRLNPMKWTVPELLPLSYGSCNRSETLLTDKSVICENTSVFEDKFLDAGIDQQKWTLENYIPQTPDFEFVSYQNDQCHIEDKKLFIEPKYATNEAAVRGTLDLRHKCTRQNQDLCVYSQVSSFILPPITTGRMVSKFKFKYGEVSIKAKLPAGDWIYPEIYVEEVNEPHRRIVIAYARGNEQYTSNSGEDIGGRLLFGGPVTENEEPERSLFLRTKRNSVPFSNDFHVYTMRWAHDRITLKIDNEEYGFVNDVDMQRINFANNDMAQLVLGVGVGGVNDFPDGYKSGTKTKPWINKETRQMKKFFNARNEWGQTWSGKKAALQVEYVKITTI